MKSPTVWFNIYLLLLIPLIPLLGCKSNPWKKKDLTTLRFYLEVNPDGTDRNGPVSVYRHDPIYINVQKAPFLKEGHVEKALVVDTPGGFEIHLELARKGRLILEQFSTAYRGKRAAIYCVTEEARFIAAPVFRKTITDGTFVFTPDATREEADRIVLGLNNIAEKIRKEYF